MPDADLDVAVKGRGWIAVQNPNGGESYVRTGSLNIDALGVLRAGNAIITVSAPADAPVAASNASVISWIFLLAGMVAAPVLQSTGGGSVARPVGEQRVAVADKVQTNRR